MLADAARRGRVYSPGTVPCHPWLWSPEDDAARHCRRYTRSGLARVLRNARFEVEYLTCFFWFLPLPVLLLRVLPGWLGVRAAPSAKSARREHAGAGGVLVRSADWAVVLGAGPSARRSNPADRRKLSGGRTRRPVADMINPFYLSPSERRSRLSTPVLPQQIADRRDPQVESLLLLVLDRRKPLPQKHPGQPGFVPGHPQRRLNAAQLHPASLRTAHLDVAPWFGGRVVTFVVSRLDKDRGLADPR